MKELLGYSIFFSGLTMGMWLLDGVWCSILGTIASFLAWLFFLLNYIEYTGMRYDD